MHGYRYRLLQLPAPPAMRALDIAKAAWAAPCSVIGLLVAALPLALGGKATWHARTLEVTYRPTRAACGKLALVLPFRGIVFGHVILAVTREELEVIRPHERVHVLQYERWGPLFFIAYGGSSLWQFLRGHSPYWHNCFERQAREQCGEINRTEGAA